MAVTAFPDGAHYPDGWFSDYEVHDLINEGGQANVYHATWLPGRSECALKIYRRKKESIFDSSIVGVLEAWKLVSADKSEKRLVRLEDFKQYQSGSGPSRRYTWYERQEFIAGGDLARMVHGDWSLDEFERLVEEMYRMISFAQTRMVDGDVKATLTHNDIKPENILVRSGSGDKSQLELALGDFGIARAMAKVSRSQAVKSTVFGTARYMAPEVRLRRRSSAADWWAMGIILAEALLGGHPWALFMIREGALEGIDRWSEEDEAQLPDFVSQRPFADLGIEVADDHVSRLLRGLLNREHSKRWTGPDVAQWLRKEAAEPPKDTFGGTEGGGVVLTRGFRFLGEVFVSPQRLIRAMQIRWRESTVDYLATGGQLHLELMAWMKEAGLEAAHGAVEAGGSPHARLARLATLYVSDNPVFQPEYDIGRSGALTLSNLQKVAEDVLESRLTLLADEDEVETVNETLDEKWIRELFESKVCFIWGCTSLPELEGLAEFEERWRVVYQEFDRLRPDIWAEIHTPGETRSEGYFLSAIGLAILDPTQRDDLRRAAREGASDNKAALADWYQEIAETVYNDDRDIARDLLLVECRTAAARLEQKTMNFVEANSTGFRGLISKVSEGRIFGLDERTPPVILHFVARPSTIVEGAEVLLDWEVLNAEVVRLNGQPVANRGKKEGLVLYRTTQLELVATSRGGKTRTQRLTIDVHSKPTQGWVSVEPETIARGQPVKVTWSIPRAREVWIEGIGLAPGEGTLVDHPAHNRRYRITGKNDAGTFTASSNPVHVIDVPAIDTQMIPFAESDIQVEVPVVLMEDLADILQPQAIDLVGDMAKVVPTIPPQVLFDPPWLPDFPSVDDLTERFPVAEVGSWPSSRFASREDLYRPDTADETVTGESFGTS